jgi:hypothetical protein
VGSIIDSAASPSNSDVVVRYLEEGLSNEQIRARMTLALKRAAERNVQLAFVLPMGREVLLGSLAKDARFASAIADNRLQIFAHSQAGRLSMFLRNYDKKNGTDPASRPGFRFLFPGQMNLDDFVDVADLPAERYRFYILVTEALNSIAVEVQQRQMQRDQLKLMLDRVMSQA